MERTEAERRLEAVETKLAYLEDFVQRLQAETLERNAVSDKLAAEHAAMKEKLLEMASRMEEMPHERPPHY